MAALAKYKYHRVMSLFRWSWAWKTWTDRQTDKLPNDSYIPTQILWLWGYNSFYISFKTT